MTIEFHIPVRPYSPIDAHNRAAAAMGGTANAVRAARADYNGHHVTLHWNSHHGYYVAEYVWAGRVVLARGSFPRCLRAVIEEQERGALGSSATIVVPATDESAIAEARATAGLVEGSIWENDSSFGRRIRRADWWTWRHQVGHESARDMARPQSPVLIFDWPLCEAADSRESYESAVMAKYGRVYQ